MNSINITRSIKLLTICILMTTLILTLGACSKTNTNEFKNYKIQLYYVNEEYVNTGNENLEKLMKPYETSIDTAKDKLGKDIIDQLKTAPNQPSYGTMVTDKIAINSFTISGETGTIDIASSGLNGSSTQEDLFISQVTNTIFLNFPDINEIQFLVDGKVVESLMGHIGADKPFSRIKK